METYTKINTLFKRYQFNGNDCPNKKWLKMKNKIILNSFSEPEFAYLFENEFEAYCKIDGTNSKICFYPSSGEIFVGGKSDNAQSQHGQFEYLQIIADRIHPILAEIFPPESARFVPATDGNGKIIIADGNKVTLEETPIYIYGEYYGAGIQKCGKRYSNENHFAVFDIEQQGWWLPSDKRHELCEKLSLDEVPLYSDGITLQQAIIDVSKGFTTLVDNVADKTLVEEGLVLRPTVPIKTSRGKRLIVKVKYIDFADYENVRKEFTDEEFAEFEKWYKTL